MRLLHAMTKTRKCAVAAIPCCLLFVETLSIAQSRERNISPEAHPSVLYVDRWRGSDDNTGSSDHPFQSIQKAAILALPGDTIMIRAGTYRETIIPSHSGSEDASITIQAAPHEIVRIDGADPLAGWSVDQGSVYKTQMNWDLGADRNQVFLDGKMLPEASFPGPSPNPIQPHYSRVKGVTGVDVKAISPVMNRACMTLHDPALKEIAIPNWEGATIHMIPGLLRVAMTGDVVGGNEDSVRICANYPHPPGVFIDADRDYMPALGTPFFLTGKGRFLSLGAGWILNAGTRTIFLRLPSDEDPNSHALEAKTRQYAFDLREASFIHINNIELVASSIITGPTSTGIVLDGIRADYVSHRTSVTLHSPGNDTGIILNGHGNEIRNSDISWSSGNGILVQGVGNRVTDCVVRNVDYVPENNSGIQIWGRNHSVTFNTIYNTGKAGIQHTGHSLKILHNEIHTVGLLGNDEGGTYSSLTDGETTEIAYNLIHDVIRGRPRNPVAPNAGIYLDNGSHNYSVHDNIVWNAELGITLNAPRKDAVPAQLPQNAQVSGNKFFASVACYFSWPSTGDGTGARVESNVCQAPKDYDPGPLPGMIFQRNTYFPLTNGKSLPEKEILSHLPRAGARR
jgi:hypothetical protein